MSWQTIDTAPRDGTLIQLRHPDWPHNLNGRWDGVEWIASPMFARLAAPVFIADPIEWMPLNSSIR